jgi:uncharacterized phiE125 gp8 family phage protein
MKILHSLVSLESFKLLYGVDDREDELARFFLESATAQVERYCMRRLCYKKVTQGFDGTGGYYFELLDYPVHSVLSVRAGAALPLGADCAVSPADYFVSPNIGLLADYPHYLHIYPTSRIDGIRNLVKIVYFAGYKMNDVPADLKKACLELAAWNYKRHKENSFEECMSENVRQLLEPYRRKTI